MKFISQVPAVPSYVFHIGPHVFFSVFSYTLSPRSSLQVRH